MTNLLPKLFYNPFFKDPFEAMGDSLERLGRVDFANYSIYETYSEDGKFVAVFNMPGHTGMDDIQADVDKETGLIKVQSKKEEETHEEKEGRTYHHKSQSRYSYAFYLPENVDFTSASASCEKGQLKITFAYKDALEAKESKTLSIPIESLDEKV